MKPLLIRRLDSVLTSSAAMLLAVATVCLMGHAPAIAQELNGDCDLDQSQPDGPIVLAITAAPILGQSFTPTERAICGIEVLLGPSQPASGTLIIELWDETGTELIRSASTVPAPDEFVHVDWEPVAVAPGTPYRLLFRPENVLLHLAGSDQDPYPGGTLLADGSPAGDLDAAFRTFGICAPIDQQQVGYTETLNSLIQIQTFSPRRSMICGGSFLTTNLSTYTIYLSDANGRFLASGNAEATTVDGWATATWPPVMVDVNSQYILAVEPIQGEAAGYRFNADPNSYPDGEAVNMTGDLAFRTLGAPCETDQSQLATDDIGNILPEGFAQSFVPATTNSCGARLRADDLIEGSQATVELRQTLFGPVLAQGTDTDLTDGWIDVDWNPVRTTSQTYFLVLRHENVLRFWLEHDDKYPFGSVWGPKGTEAADSDFAFETFGFDLDCLDGNVNQTAELVLSVNFDHGDAGWVSVPAGGALLARIQKPSAGGNGKFVIHANWGAPTSSTAVSLPGQIGTACFDMLLPAAGGNASPAAVWNNLGKEGSVGTSTFFDGTSIVDPMRAPTDFLVTQAVGQLSLGTMFTLEGVIVDPNTGANKPVSKTNAVTVVIQ